MRRMLLTSFAFVVFFTVLAVAYTFVMLGIGQGVFAHQANGSMLHADGREVGSSLLGQGFTDARGNPLPQYFQPRPSEAGSGYDPTSSGSRSYGPTNPLLLGYVPGVSIVDTNGELVRDGAGHTLGTNPFATPADPYCVPLSAKTGAPATGTLSTPYSGVGDPSRYRKDPDGTYACDPDTVPQRAIAYRALNGLAPGAEVPVDAVTVSFSGLDPEISVSNAALQAPRVARVRGLALGEVESLVKRSTSPRPLGILGEPGVNVLELNIALDQLHRR